MSFSYDITPLRKLAEDLGKVPAAAVPELRKALEVTARGVKDDWIENATGLSRKHAKRYPKSIDYDMFGLTATIGPNLGRAQGSLGFLEDAPGGIRAAPQHAGRKALASNEADFLRGIDIALGRVL